MSQGYGDAGRLTASCQDGRASVLVFLQVKVVALKRGLQLLQYECPHRCRLVGARRRTDRLESPTGVRKLFVFADNGHNEALTEKRTGIKRFRTAGDHALVISFGGRGRRQQFTDSDLQWRKNKIGGISLVEFIGGFLDRPT
jgi:hypothetical protein